MRLTVHRRRKHPAAGFTLLEVLITIIVLGVGLLGLSLLQTQGLRYNHSAQLRSQATFFAYDLADRMRAMRENVPILNEDETVSFTLDADSVPESCPFASPSLCNVIDSWKQSLQSMLPASKEAVIELRGNRIAAIRIVLYDLRGQDSLTEFDVMTRI